MKKLRSLAAAALALSLGVVALGACGQKTAGEDKAKDTTPAAKTGETTPQTTGVLNQKGEKKEPKALKIAIVTSPSGVDDGSFNEDNYNGIQAFLESYGKGSTVSPIKEPTGNPVAAIKTLQDVAPEYDVVVACGFQFGGLKDVATANPETKFILVDTFPSEVGEPLVLDNVYAMTFAEQESGFFAGLAAALESKSKKVAVVNGIAFPSNVNYQYGFMAGVNYANAKLGTKVEIVELPSYAGTDVTQQKVGGNYVGNFNDEATGKVVGKALIDKGVDVIFVAAGGSGNGVFAAAKEAKDVFVIGCDVDQFKDGKGGAGNVVLTSVLKIMGKNVEKQLNKVVDGSFKGENALLKADTDSTGYVSKEGHMQLKPETLKALEEAYDKVKKGEIVPPANFDGQSPTAFKGLQ